ncbi:VPS15 [Candida oxycetoniae]|uniref:non-specific serine/threonine protein kinase n=1 Tax=Candida oxycetoniae TaxID=497107 RepID=A0AAI9WW72_9ASCO|nr:VPS15 [Candida oxycetoniae]KAI3402920.2 VPS15 [Candida oxycetoniae]
MGQRLSLLAPSAPTVAVSSYVDALDNYQFVELLNNSRFLKTIKAIDKTNGYLVIIKILIKPSTPNYTIQFHGILELLVKQSSILYPYKSTLTWHKLIETDRAGYLIRQMGKTNLYDRLSLRPFLEPIEKLFITFQLLKTVSELHALNIHHGDLRLENILVTSSNWVLLTDFASLTKPVFLPEDNPNQFSFYFDSSGRRVCYIAPERFYNSSDNPKNISNFNDDGVFKLRHVITDEMDLFSLGCVLAELWLDGEPTFTLSQLFKFMKNDYVPELSNIPNPNMIKLLQKLIRVNPGERTGARELLEEFKGLCFPEFFNTFLYGLMESFNDQSKFTNKNVPDGKTTSITDNKLNYLYNKYDEISKNLGFVYAQQQQQQQQKVVTTDPLPMKLNLPGMPHDYRIQPKRYVDEDVYESALIILDLVTSFSKSLKFVESKVKCCELILSLSEHMNDESKLDRSLPYLCSMLDEYIEATSYHQAYAHHQVSPKVVCTAVYAITSLVMSCSYITPINVLLFPEYLLPKIYALLNLKTDPHSQRLVNGCVAACLPYLAVVAKKFWTMSKAFKATYSTNAASLLPDEVIKSVTMMNLSKDQLVQKFKDLTLLLLTDSEASVKVSLLENILPLCQFFGKDKTNDIILPHLISYLNDPNPTLRLAFLSAVLQMGPFIGALSFEQYILPLLIQTVGEGDQLVILKVLEIFNFFVSEKLINARLEFNALEIYTELLSSSIYLLLHPNEWIRQSLMSLIISISNNLTDADRYCFLYPLIKGYLVYDVFKIDWNTLYPSLTRPISKQAFDMANTWALNFTSKSLFWQQKSFSLLQQQQQHKHHHHHHHHHHQQQQSQHQYQYNSDGQSKRRVIAFSKNMGKSVYLPKMSTVISYNSGRSKENVPLSSEDKQWLLKLKSIGIGDKSLWKLFVLRDYIYRVSRITPTQTSHFEQTTVTPRNVFLDVIYKTEPVVSANESHHNEKKIICKSGDAVSVKSIEHSLEHSLVLPNMERVTASVQTVEANVFGEMELSNGISSKPSYLSDPSFSHKTFHVSESRIITSYVKHTYTGSNPFILKYLQNLKLTATLEDFPVFGKVVKARTSSTVEEEMKEPNIFDLNVRRTSEDIDAFTCLTMSPTLEFFVTGSENGVVKIWDSLKLENITRAKNSNQSIEFNSRITSLTFLKNRCCLIVTTRDGMIRILRIDVLENKNKKIQKILKPVVIRSILAADSFITHVRVTDNLMCCADYQSKINVYDMTTMDKLYSLQNPLSYGLVTSLIVGEAEHSWAIIGTNSGYLTLLDLRFKILVKSWNIEVTNSNQGNTTVPIFFPHHHLSTNEAGLTEKLIEKLNLYRWIHVYYMVKRNREDEHETETHTNTIALNEASSFSYVECLYCGSKYVSYLDCESHIMMSHQNRCLSCSKVFPNEHILNLHIDEVHNVFLRIKRESGQATLCCFSELCSQQFSSLEQRRLHLIEKHNYPSDYPFSITSTGI